MSERSAQIERVSELLSNLCNVALHAAPGTGKTWLADRVAENLLDRGGSIVRLDMSLFSGGTQFFEALSQVDESSDPEHTMQSAWAVARRVLGAQDGAQVVVLDEFDSVAKFPDAFEFLPLFRELIHRPNVTKLAALIVSRRPLEAIESQVRGISTLATVCFPEYLGSIQAEDLSDSWLEGARMDEGEHLRCLAWSAGYPPLVRFWLSSWPNEPSETVGGNQLALHFGRLVDYLDLLGLSDAAAQLVLGPVVEDWIREPRQLEALGVLPSGERTGYAGHEIFRLYLRQRTLNLNPWGVLGLAEIRLRSLIAEILGGSLGTGWEDVVAQSSKALRVLMNAARGKQSADLARFGRSGDWLAYTYPQDLGDIILSNWSLFQGVFKAGDKQYWAERFSKLSQYRTPVAHNRVEVLSQAQRTQCRLYAEEILVRIDEYQSASQIEALQTD